MMKLKALLDVRHVGHVCLVAQPLAPMPCAVPRASQVVRALLPMRGPAPGGTCWPLDVPVSQLWPFSKEQREFAQKEEHVLTPRYGTDALAAINASPLGAFAVACRALRR